MPRLVALLALLLLVTPAWADGFKGFDSFNTFSDSSSQTTTVIIERSPLDYSAEPYMGYPYMDPPNLRTSYNYRVSLYPYQFCCQGYYFDYGYRYGGYRW